MKMNNLSFPLHFLFAAYPELMSKVLGIATRTQSTHLAHQAGLRKKEAHTGAATVIQRFGSALNLNIHLTCPCTADGGGESYGLRWQMTSLRANESQEWLMW